MSTSTGARTDKVLRYSPENCMKKFSTVIQFGELRYPTHALSHVTHALSIAIGIMWTDTSHLETRFIHTGSLRG